MKHYLTFSLALLCAGGALADVARPVLQSTATKALTDDLKTGAHTLSISAAGGLTFESGFTLTGAANLSTALGIVPPSLGGLGADASAATGFPLFDGTGGVTFLEAVDADHMTPVIGPISIGFEGTNPNISVNAAGQVIAISAVDLTDVTTGNVSTSKHGLMPKSSANVLSFIGASNYAAMKTLLTLNNVENTALSTWVGTSNITTTGTVTSGTWSGSFGAVSGANLTTLNASNISSGSLALARIAQGSATSGQALAWNGTAWAPATIASGLTIGTTTISGGTSGRLLTSGATVGELTPGTGVSTALGNAVNGTGGLLTYGIIGTSGAAVPMLNTANTWASGQVFGGSSGDYLSLASSGTLELRISSGAFGLGTSAFLFGKYDSGSLQPASSATVYFEMVAGFRGDALFYGDIYFNDGTSFTKPVTDHLMLFDKYTNSNSCRFSVANTRASSTNYEAGVIDWQTTSNTLRIGSDVGSGGGTARDVAMIRGGTVKITIGANTTDHAQPVKLPSYIVSGLPSASTCGAGAMAFVTDATLTTTYTTVIGGGGSQVLVISDGTNWIIH